jgi:hypothetical protein
MQTIRWCKLKVDLPEADPADERFVMSQDVEGKPGAKQFAAFAGPRAAIKYAAIRAGSPLYEVVEHPDRPCKMFLDLDRADTVFDTQVVIDQLLELVERVTLKDFAMSFVPVPGSNCQVSQATSDVKTSVHAVFNVRVASVVAHRYLAKRLAFVVVDNPEEYPALLGSDGKCVIDLAIYTKFRSFRMLGMVKLGKKYPLQPCMGSSTALADHLVGYYPSMHTDGKLVDLPAPTNVEAPLILACRSQERVQRVATRSVPITQFAAFEKTLNSWLSVTDTFPAGVRIAAVTETKYCLSVRLHKQCCAACPYAKRRHRSNNLYLNVALDWTRAEVQCFDQACRGCIDKDGALLLLPNATNNTGYDSSHAGTGGMHSQVGNVQWDERYNEPTMRPLPVRPIVCVRAGMGIGKTIAMKDLLGRVCTSSTKVLVVTFSRSLAVKMSAEFEHLGFVNYQKVDGLIQDAKVVVCLDSLFRIATRNFDFVILDECVSTFLHFNSTLMVKRAENSALLELLLTQATTGIYFIDAALDFTFMKNIVDYFAVAKREQPLWIYNEHVRPTNRKAHVVLCDDPCMGAVTEYSLIFATAKCVLDKLVAGEKVVCCSSTKKFTEVLARFIAERRPDALVKVYNSASASEDLRLIGTEWVKYDLLIYSPSISAGVSFEVQHFDSLVAYLVSSPFTPSVDKALQQLFRVRQLTTGDMRIFVHNTRPSVKLPHTIEEITPLLSSDISLVSRYFVSHQLSFFAQVRVTPTTVEYDRDRLSWQIILGIIQMHSSSAMFFTDTLVETLQQDYGIPVQVHKLTSGQDARNLDLVALQEAASFRKNPSWDEVRILSVSECDELKSDMENISVGDKASIKLFSIQHGVWGVKDELVDERFYNELVMSAAAADEYYRVGRFKKLTTRTLAENRATLTNRITDILGMDDKNLELYKAKCKVHLGMLVTGQSIITRLLGVEAMDTLTRLDRVVVKDEDVSRVVNDYVQGLSRPELTAFNKLFGIKSDTTAYRTLFKVALKAFGIEVGRESNNSERPGWHNIKLQNKRLRWIEETYMPTYPHAPMGRAGPTLHA